MARATIDRSEFSPDDWRGLAKHLRELALGTMDDRTRARMFKQADAYELTASKLDGAGEAPIPNRMPSYAVSSFIMRIGPMPVARLRIFRRMLAWRPRRVGI